MRRENVAMTLDATSFAFTEYVKSGLLAWSPRQIDLARDQTDWAWLGDPERAIVLRLVQLAAAIQSTTLRHLPALAIALDRRGAPSDDLLFAAAQGYETARHVEWHIRWLADVAQPGPEPADFQSDDHYRALVDEDLPGHLDRLLGDESDAAVLRAVATCHLVCTGVIVESVLAELAAALRRNELLPGLTYGLDLVRRDAARHADYGVDLAVRVRAAVEAERQAVEVEKAADSEVPEIEVEKVVDSDPLPPMSALLAAPLTYAAGTLAAVFRPWGATAPLGIEIDRIAETARGGLGARVGRLG